MAAAQNWISGLNDNATTEFKVPALFGLNFQATSIHTAASDVQILCQTDKSQQFLAEDENWNGTLFCPVQAVSVAQKQVGYHKNGSFTYGERVCKLMTNA